MCLFFVPIYFLLQVSVLPDDAARQLPNRASPRIGRFTVAEGEPFYYIFVEQQPILKLQNLLKAFMLWFMVHYVFNLLYHKYCSDMALFIQEFVFDIQDAKKKSAKYLSTMTGIHKSASD